MRCSNLFFSYLGQFLEVGFEATLLRCLAVCETVTADRVELDITNPKFENLHSTTINLDTLHSTTSDLVTFLHH